GLRFRYELTLLDAEAKEIPGARPIRHGLVGEAPAPALEAWAIQLVPAASAGSAGPPLFRARAKIANLAPDFGPAMSVPLMRCEPHTNSRGLPLPVLTVLARKDVSVSARSAAQPGELIADFVLSDDEMGRLPRDPPAQLFAVLSFPDGKNGGQPFAELVR